MRSLRRDDDPTCGSCKRAASCKGGRFYAETACGSCCSGAAILWSLSVAGWVGFIAFVFFKQKSDLFRPLLFSSPVLITLFITFGTCLCGCGGTPTAGKTGGFAFFMFLMYWTIFQAYPVQCRSAWGSAMVSDETYWHNHKAIGMAVKKENQEFFPWEEANPYSWQGQLTRPLTSRGIHKNNTVPKADSKRMYKLLKEGEANKSSVGGKWMTPVTRGDSYQNFLLRAYCNLHRFDAVLPHVYPLRLLGVNPVEVPFKAPCPYWACILTEPRSGGKLAFLWILAVPAAVNLLHSRVAGACSTWWAWLWGALLPLWLVMLIKSSQDTELVPFVVEQISVVFELHKWFRGNNTPKDNARLGTLLIVGIGGGLSYYYRDRLRVELGLHEWLPFVFSGARIGGRHTFQVCVWRVDVKARHEMDEEGSAAASNSSSLMGRGLKTLGLPFFSGKSYSGYAALFGGRTALPDSLSVRLCHGNDEVQRTRVQQLGGYCRASDVYLFQENFTLSLEQRSGTQFKVDIRGTTRTGADFSSDVTFDSNKLERAFQRSADAAGRHRGGIRSSIADEQILQMRSATSASIEKDDEIKSWGFQHYPGSNGGEIWLAFCDLEDDDDDQGCC